MSSSLFYSTNTPSNASSGTANQAAPKDNYNVTCFDGHVFAVLADTELEELCKAQPETHISAMVIASKDCPDCIEDQRDRQRRNADMESLCGCPIGGINCTGKSEDGSDCACTQDRQPIPESKYRGQLRGYNPWE
jgi:hypothetical protein